MTLSDQDKEDIETAIYNVGSNDVPAIVQRITEYHEARGNQIANWCATDNPDAAWEAFEELFEGGMISYLPTDEEILAEIIIGNRANIVLNYDRLLNPVNYAEISFCAGCSSSETIDVQRWYDDRGYYPCQQYLPATYKEDLNEIRLLKFTTTIAHELGHLQHHLESPIEYGLWYLIRKRDDYEDIYRYLKDNAIVCYPGLNPGNQEYCASHAGHELENPDNSVTCDAESSVIDSEMISDETRKIRITFCHQ